MAGRRSALVGEGERGEISPTDGGVQRRANSSAVRASLPVTWPASTTPGQSQSGLRCV